MNSPTIEQIHSAIEILAKLGERLNVQAAHSIAQLPETPLGAYYAGNIGSQTIDRTARIENIATQLKIWEDELAEQKRNVAAKPKARTKTRLHEVFDKCMVLEEKYFKVSTVGNLQTSSAR